MPSSPFFPPEILVRFLVLLTLQLYIVSFLIFFLYKAGIYLLLDSSAASDGPGLPSPPLFFFFGMAFWVFSFLFEQEEVLSFLKVARAL